MRSRWRTAAAGRGPPPKAGSTKAEREKAFFKNPDEYYMKMAHTKTEGGVHRKREAVQPTHDETLVFKREDAGYLMVKQTSEAKVRTRAEPGTRTPPPPRAAHPSSARSPAHP